MSNSETQPDTELGFGPDTQQFSENNCPNFEDCPFMRQYFEPMYDRERRRRRRRPYYYNRPFYPYPYFFFPFFLGRDYEDYD